MNAPRRVLFVCTGNICRSPTAHGLLRALLAERGLAGRIEVDSAGFEDWHVGEPPDPRSVATARRRGVEIGDLRARQLVDADFAAFDLVVGLDPSHVERARARCDPARADRICSMGAYCGLPPGEGVPDPYDGSEEDFERVFALIDTGCRRLLDELAAERAAGGAVDALVAAFGPAVVQRPPEFGDRRFADWSRMPSAEPLAWVRPRSTAEVAEVLRICHAHRQPVVTQGGLTGLAGGACLLGGEIALSLERMGGVEAIDPVSATMTVWAGTPLQTAQEAAEEAGFLFPLDLGARGSCTIGGNLATNAGGNRVIRYGMMRDQVLDLEAVLADGRVIGGCRAMIKNNTGYDLRHLLIGSEGTLAVITRAVLRLRPRPRAVHTAWCGLPSFKAVTTLLAQAQARLPSGVSAFEVMWPGYHDFVIERLPALRRPLADRHAYYVLLESLAADPQREGEAFEALLGTMLEDGVLGDAALAASASDAKDFWAIRDAPGEYPRLLPGRTSFDLSFTVAGVGRAAQRIEDELRALRPAARVLIYGHLGDGNIHVVVHEPDWDADAVRSVQALVYGVTRELGGSVSAEHGIGTKKLGVIEFSRSADEVAAMKAIKAALDPRGILNPGKLLA